jgi:uncharacterized membrane protein YccC
VSPSSRWHPVTFLRAHDPGLLALKRSVRAAVIVPSAFAIAWALTSDIQVPLFASFGAFSLLLLVDLGGSRASRLRGYALLIVAATALIVIGSLCSNQDILAVISMGMAAFVVLFSGVLSPTAALGSTYLLLAYVLPVNVPVPPGQIPDRLAGWALAALLGLPALLLIWPSPPFDVRRSALARAAQQLAVLVRAHAEGHRDPAAHASASRALDDLRKGFAATPYPPTGLGSAQVALAKLVSRIERAGALAVVGPDEVALALNSPTARELNAATARVLHGVSALIGPIPAGRPPDRPAATELTAALEDLHRDRRASFRWAVDRLVRQVSGGGTDAAASARAFLDPTFRARALGLATEEIGALALEAAGFDPPTLPGSAPTVSRKGYAATARAVWQRAGTHLTLRSVWLRNSLRGAVGLALAVAVARITGVSHGFWVALGAMSVLRSNALGTGATAVRALAGTVVGFAVGTAIMLGVGGHTVALWFILPLAVLFAGAAASVISFVAGQAGFTIMVVVLFNILVPAGWSVGLVRVEDVALGCAVSVAVGLLLWPRGATAAFSRALCDAYRAGSHALVAAVDRLVSPGLAAHEAGDRATAAYHRLDDAYRQFLAERGAKVISLRTATHLFTGAARLRLAAYSLATLPALSLDAAELASAATDGGAAVASAAAELRRAYHRTDAWYDGFGAVLRGERDPMPAVADGGGQVRPDLMHAFVLVSEAGDAAGVRMVLRMLWADEYLEDEQALQRDLADAARILAKQAHRHLI